MFKCTECEKMYDIKPEFCDDCGSDTFEEIITPAAKEVVKKEPKIAPQPKPEPEPAPKKVSSSIPKREIDYPSLGFLGVCVLISLYIIFFAWNSKVNEEIVQNTTVPEVKKDVNIPNLNTFWNSEPPKVQPKQNSAIVSAPKAEDVKPQIVEAPKIQEPPQKIQNKAPKKVETIKPAQTVQKTSATVKQPQTVKKQTQAAQKAPATVKQQQTVQKPAQTTTKKPVQTVQKPVQTTTQTVQKSVQTVQQPIQQQSVQQPTVNTAAIKQELANYKVALRNTIGRKIDFANVIGDGTCTVSFKINSSGRLINRAFSKQSTNTTLNDAVYAAVMATPSYSAPPSGYKNETLYLKITFYNGNFQISLN